MAKLSKTHSVGGGILQRNRRSRGGDSFHRLCLIISTNPGNNDHISTLPLDENEYYSLFSKYSLSSIQESTPKPGKNLSAAARLFPYAFNKKCCGRLPPQCQPELATKVKEPARATSGGEMKPTDIIIQRRSSSNGFISPPLAASSPTRAGIGEVVYHNISC
eukprot:scaffold5931_cov173-Ochromonas_danica.AAC.5